MFTTQKLENKLFMVLVTLQNRIDFLILLLVDWPRKLLVYGIFIYMGIYSCFQSCETVVYYALEDLFVVG